MDEEKELERFNREDVRLIIENECIARVPNGSKELLAKGGNGYYGWQFYLRRAVLDPRCLEVIAEDFWAKFTDLYKKTHFQLAGVEQAGVPILTAIILGGYQLGFDVNAFTIRKERKNYGRHNLLEGAPSHDPVLFIDDLTSPEHDTLWHAFIGITHANLPIVGYGYVLVLKKQATESKIIHTTKGDMKVESLFTLSDFILPYDDYEAHIKGKTIKRKPTLIA